MRPINIKINAFGPYKDFVSIDFTKFYDKGMFLITGATGSGKTTIFDAMCFALFGNASGLNRDKSSFRSDFASSDDKTYVIFEFSHKGVIYKVERSPSYVRKKKRGEGNTLVNGDAVITYLDKVITGDKNVSDKCIDILGINYLQFKQISMIAQGEFLKLLLSKSSERADIFRKIFDTGMYKEISDRLKKQYLDIKKDYDYELVNLSNLMDSVIWDNSNVSDLNVEDFLDLLEIEIHKDMREDDKLSVKKTKLFNKIQKITSKIDNALEINSNFEKYETLKREKEIKLKGDIDKKRELVSCNEDIYELISPLYDDVMKCRLLIDEKNKNLLANKKVYSDICDNYDSLMVEYSKKDDINSKLDNLKLELGELEKKLPLFLEIDNLNLELDKLKNIYSLLKIDEINKLIDKFNNNNKLMIKYRKESNKFIEVRDRYNHLSDDYKVMYNKFINCQAGLLALDLNEGDACPVCGSLVHPNKANISFDVVTKEELDRLNDDVLESQKELEILSNIVSSLSKELEISNKEIEGLDIVFLEEEIKKYKACVYDWVDITNYNLSSVERECEYIKGSLDNKYSYINKEFNRDSLEEKIKSVKLEINKLTELLIELDKSYNSINSERIRLSSVIGVLEKEIISLDNELIKLIEQYEIQYKDLGYDNEEQYLSLKLDKSIYLDYQNQIDTYDKEMLRLESNIKTISELIKGKKKINVDELVDQKDVFNKQFDDIELSVKEVNSRLNNNKIIFDKVNLVHEKIKVIEKRLSIYEDLSNTANGSIKGKNKLEFEQYVQAYYFDNVLVSANKRFSYMTDSRYYLLRKVESSKLSDKLGLELEVFDNYTGKIRDVSSLSGGESFKAALSLSLGISDVIQSYAGGIVVEALFIDEGFGSLDNESLDQALNAISLLNNDSLIGIISHVDELKNRIDNKIVISKSNNGSSVSVVT